MRSKTKIFRYASTTSASRRTRTSSLLTPYSSLSLTVQYASDEKSLPSRPQIRRWVASACEKEAQVTIRFVDAAEGQALNHEFRGKDYATNVLSFPYEKNPVVGDLVVCVPVVKREAKEQNKRVADHFAHLIVHGMLHLQGYDHESGTAQAQRMEKREREILARFRIDDPY